MLKFFSVQESRNELRRIKAFLFNNILHKNVGTRLIILAESSIIFKIA